MSFPILDPLSQALADLFPGESTALPILATARIVAPSFDQRLPQESWRRICKEASRDQLFALIDAALDDYPGNGPLTDLRDKLEAGNVSPLADDSALDGSDLRLTVHHDLVANHLTFRLLGRGLDPSTYEHRNEGLGATLAATLDALGDISRTGESSLLDLRRLALELSTRILPFELCDALRRAADGQRIHRRVATRLEIVTGLSPIPWEALLLADEEPFLGETFAINRGVEGRELSTAVHLDELFRAETVEAFCRRLADACLTRSFAVSNEAERTFLDRLEDALRSGETLPDAALAVRRELLEADPGDPAPLAYAVYGHPQARCTT